MTKVMQADSNPDLMGKPLKPVGQYVRVQRSPSTVLNDKVVVFPIGRRESPSRLVFPVPTKNGNLERGKGDGSTASVGLRLRNATLPPTSSSVRVMRTRRASRSTDDH